MEKDTIREMNPDEVGKLKICIEELARYHNTVSINFKGIIQDVLTILHWKLSGKLWKINHR